MFMSKLKVEMIVGACWLCLYTTQLAVEDIIMAL